MGARPMKRETLVEYRHSVSGLWLPLEHGAYTVDGEPTRAVERWVTEWAPVEGEAGA